MPLVSQTLIFAPPRYWNFICVKGYVDLWLGTEANW